jgi:octaprenyl-diphosphate synthase
MRLFGENVGMAFQIKDDLFDYGEDVVGKPVGIDIKEKKMTLPLIYALQNANWVERKKIIYKIRNNSENKDTINEIINFVKNSGGLEYSQKVMNNYYQEAISLLAYFPESAFKKSLATLVTYTIERKK